MCSRPKVKILYFEMLSSECTENKLKNGLTMDKSGEFTTYIKYPYNKGIKMDAA